ncbi:MAG TPA: RagB/SusD family nutrient uptake outer membrane protein, partial [Puia sp.]
ERVGEVKFLRAFFYSLLFQNYGGVPLISKPLNDQTQGDSIFVPRSSMDSTLAFIEADCDSAALLLPLTSTETGRATKGAALTLKGAVELFAASPLINTANDPAKWAKAAATNLAVMNLGVYSLFPDYAAQFLAANNWNSEQIFCRGYALPNNGHKREGYLGPTIVNGTEQAWGNLSPTQNIVDDYLMSNGKPITDPTSGYDPQHPYLNREKRFYQSIVYDSSVWQGYVILTRMGGNNQIDLGSSSDISNTGYYARKTLDESINGGSSLSLAPNTSNYTYYRYAEVLLNYAEAQNEAVGPDQSVYDAVNAVRARSAVPAVTPGLSQDEMRTVLRRERRIELAFEDKRWNDIRRWDITTKGPAVLTHPQYGMLIQPNGSGVLTYTKVVVYDNSFSEYMSWLPVPEGVMEQNTKLAQNGGY